MSIPKMPVFKKPEKHQLKGALQRQIRQVICALCKVTLKATGKETLIRYLGIIYPGKEMDVTKLPFDTMDGSTKQETLTACLYAKVSWMVQLYWRYYLTDSDDTSEIRKILTDLETVAQKGLGACKVAGNVKDGFRLEIK